MGSQGKLETPGCLELDSKKPGGSKPRKAEPVLALDPLHQKCKKCPPDGAAVAKKESQYFASEAGTKLSWFLSWCMACIWSSGRSGSFGKMSNSSESSWPIWAVVVFLQERVFLMKRASLAWVYVVWKGTFLCQCTVSTPTERKYCIFMLKKTSDVLNFCFALSSTFSKVPVAISKSLRL